MKHSLHVVEVLCHEIGYQGIAKSAYVAYMGTLCKDLHNKWLYQAQ